MLTRVLDDSMPMWSSSHKVLYAFSCKVSFPIKISQNKMDGRAESKYSHILLGKYNDKSKKIIMVNRISPAIHAVLSKIVYLRS